MMAMLVRNVRAPRILTLSRRHLQHDTSRAPDIWSGTRHGALRFYDILNSPAGVIGRSVVKGHRGE